MRARALIAFASLFAVLAVAWLARGKTSPGPLSPVHAQVERLRGEDGCELCHQRSIPMRASCASCHDEIDAQIRDRRGLHGRLAGADASSCATCHGEHHGDALPLAGAHAFAAAGIGDVAKFDHAGLDFELAGVHASLECSRCHVNAHAEVLASGEKRFVGLEQRCEGCHEDPHGGRFELSCAGCHGQERPFAELASFAHAESFPLVGAHARPSCTECHAPDGEHAIEVLGGRGEKPIARSCVDCHASPHGEALIARAAREASTTAGNSCATCHDAARGPFEQDRDALSRELHAVTGFALAGPHAEVACASCHARAARDVDEAAAYSARFPGRAADDCAACHADPHDDQFATLRCVDCHASDRFVPHRFDAERHARSAFPLTGAHAGVDCARCHQRSTPEAPIRFRGAPTACSACHADAHRGELEQAADCASCHTTESFEDRARERFDHARSTAFALTGAHATLACEACHAPRASADEHGRRFGFATDRFPGESAECATCHADVHGGAFEARAACAVCHVTEAFDHPSTRAFDHERFTGFALAGGHARASCEACHGSSDTPVVERAASGPIAHARELGRIADRIDGPIERCETCHEDPHGGRFDREGAPRGVAGRDGCARCHDVESFGHVARASFDHALWTGFALAGAHARTACEACHVSDGAVRNGMSLGRAAGTSCAACHADPHAGQFATRDGAVDCARCHESERTFATVRFDHQRDARFALDATHAALDCAACHRPASGPDGRSVVRYKPLGTRCVDCHGGFDSGSDR